MRPATAPRGQALVLRRWIVIASPARVNIRVCPRKGRNHSAELRTDRVLWGNLADNRGGVNVFAVCPATRSNKERKIFVNSMSDLFHEDVPPDYIGRVGDVMRRADWHVFQVLTKRDRDRFVRTAHRPSATCGRLREEMKVWWARRAPVGTESRTGCGNSRPSVRPHESDLVQGSARVSQYSGRRLVCATAAREHVARAFRTRLHRGIVGGSLCRLAGLPSACPAMPGTILGRLQLGRTPPRPRR